MFRHNDGLRFANGQATIVNERYICVRSLAMSRYDTHTHMQRKYRHSVRRIIEIAFNVTQNMRRLAHSDESERKESDLYCF